MCAFGSTMKIEPDGKEGFYLLVLENRRNNVHRRPRLIAIARSSDDSARENFPSNFRFSVRFDLRANSGGITNSAHLRKDVDAPCLFIRLHETLHGSQRALALTRLGSHPESLGCSPSRREDEITHDLKLIRRPLFTTSLLILIREFTKTVGRTFESALPR